jgi:hypothetical protein
MANVNVRVRYRPVRIGWCIRDNNWDDLRRALRLTHVFWGGKFNPIIPVDAPRADELVRRFRVDVLVDIADDPQTKTFMEKFEYLPWPLMEPVLFSNSSGRASPNFLDVSHPLRRIAEDVRVPESLTLVQDPFVLPAQSNQYCLVHWSEDDPLRDVLLTTFGSYPKPEDIDRDYERFIKENIRASHYWAKAEQPLPAYLLEKTTPAEISALDLNWDRIPYDTTVGFYAGRAEDFSDIVNYWNLAACGLNILFVDPAHAQRLAPLKDAHCEFLQQRQITSRHTRNETAVWSRSQEVVSELALPAELVPCYYAVDGIDLVRGHLRPALHYLTEKNVLAHLSERRGSLSLSFQFPEKPFKIEDEWEWSRQHFVVSVRNPFEEADSSSTFWIPNLPDLNQWYGRNACLRSRAVRSEVDGIGIICPITDESLELESIRKHELATKLFELAGIDARPSLPGRIASRLISQLGGLQGCRVLKIAGVRWLIRKYTPLEHFDRTEAIRTIGNCDLTTNLPRFSDYENLFLEHRDPAATRLKPEHVFLYLLDKGVFRAGLTPVCPVCELPFWLELDDVSTQVNCELCGNPFKLTRQLKDRAWSYRKSGLFGKEDSQEGSIPVALTLQQLDTSVNHSFGGSLLLTNMQLKPVGATIRNCETDLFVALPGRDRIQVAIGECKDSGGHIELDDATKLAAVADAFPSDKFDSFVIFSKTAPFTEDEVESCRAAQHKSGGLRVIMLSDRELEPYFVYEKTSQQFKVRHSAASLDDMARVTHEVFFAPKLKQS